MSSNEKNDVLTALPAMRRYARSLARDPGEAEELVQESLLRALERHSRFAGGNLRGWLLSIVHNLHVDRQRTRVRRVQRDHAYAESRAPDISPTQLDAVRLNEVRRAFDALPEEQRDALHLVTIEGMSYDEAASVLGLPAGTVMSQVSRARETLRRWETAPPLRLVKGGQE